MELDIHDIGSGLKEFITRPYNWETEPTRRWQQIAKEKIREMCNNCLCDYAKYTSTQMSSLEGMIQSFMSEATDEGATLALRSNNMSLAFEPQQRKEGRDIRILMQKLSADSNIHVQAIPVIYRPDEVIKEEEITPTNEPKSKMIYVFRLLRSGNRTVFIDTNKRVYETWPKFLDDNKIEKGMLCTTENGHLRSQLDENGNEIEQRPPGIIFREPPSCRFVAKAGEKVKTFFTYASPVITIASIVCPLALTAVGLATAATYAANVALVSTAIVQGYGAFSGSNIWDQYKHGQSIGMEAFNCVFQVVGAVASMGVSNYIRVAAEADRILTTIENIALTCVLSGTKIGQVVSLIGLVFSYRGREISAMDIFNLVLSCVTLYGIAMKPWTANGMLQQMKMQMRTPSVLQEKLDKKQKKQDVLESKIANATGEERQKLIEKFNYKNEVMHHLETELKMKSEGMVEIDNKKQDIAKKKQTVKDMSKDDPKRIKLEREIEDADRLLSTLNENYLNQTANNMIDKEAKKAFTDFYKEELLKGDGTSAAGTRLVQTVINIDVESVFKLVGKTGSHVCFANGESNKLIFNQRFEVDPETLYVYKDNLSSDGAKVSKEFERILELTSEWASDDEKAKKYISNIQTALKAVYYILTGTKIVAGAVAGINCSQEAAAIKDIATKLLPPAATACAQGVYQASEAGIRATEWASDRLTVYGQNRDELSSFRAADTQRKIDSFLPHNQNAPAISGTAASHMLALDTHFNYYLYVQQTQSKWITEGYHALPKATEFVEFAAVTPTDEPGGGSNEEANPDEINDSFEVIGNQESIIRDLEDYLIPQFFIEVLQIEELDNFKQFLYDRGIISELNSRAIRITKQLLDKTQEFVEALKLAFFNLRRDGDKATLVTTVRNRTNQEKEKNKIIKEIHCLQWNCVTLPVFDPVINVNDETPLKAAIQRLMDFILLLIVYRPNVLTLQELEIDETCFDFFIEALGYKRCYCPRPSNNQRTKKGSAVYYREAKNFGKYDEIRSQGIELACVRFKCTKKDKMKYLDFLSTYVANGDNPTFDALVDNFEICTRAEAETDMLSVLSGDLNWRKEDGMDYWTEKGFVDTLAPVSILGEQRYTATYSSSTGETATDYVMVRKGSEMYVKSSEPLRLSGTPVHFPIFYKINPFNSYQTPD